MLKLTQQAHENPSGQRGDTAGLSWLKEECKGPAHKSEHSSQSHFHWWQFITHIHLSYKHWSHMDVHWLVNIWLEQYPSTLDSFEEASWADAEQQRLSPYVEEEEEMYSSSPSLWVQTPSEKFISAARSHRWGCDCRLSSKSLAQLCRSHSELQTRVSPGTGGTYTPLHPGWCPRHFLAWDLEILSLVPATSPKLPFNIDNYS